MKRRADGRSAFPQCTRARQPPRPRWHLSGPARRNKSRSVAVTLYVTDHGDHLATATTPIAQDTGPTAGAFTHHRSVTARDRVVGHRLLRSWESYTRGTHLPGGIG